MWFVCSAFFFSLFCYCVLRSSLGVPNVHRRVSFVYSMPFFYNSLNADYLNVWNLMWFVCSAFFQPFLLLQIKKTHRRHKLIGVSFLYMLFYLLKIYTLLFCQYDTTSRSYSIFVNKLLISGGISALSETNKAALLHFEASKSDNASTLSNGEPCDIFGRYIGKSE